MRNIKITVNDPQIPVASGLSHIATSWQVSRTTDFSDTASLLINQVADATNLLSYKNSINISTYDTIYVRTKYHFNGNKSSNWSRVTSLNGDQVEIVLSDVIIQTPIVDLTIDYKNTLDGEIVINTSPFALYTGAGVHKYTTWIIETIDNEILYKRELDEDNLTSLRLSNTEIDMTNIYTIKVSYHSDTGGESNYGRYTQLTETSSEHLYDIRMVEDFVVDRKLFFNLRLYTTRYVSLDIIILDENKQIVKSLLNNNSMTPQIDTFDLIPYDFYIIQTRLKLDDGSYTPYKVLYDGMLNQNYLNNYKPMINYLDKFDYTQQMVQDGFTVQNSSELYTGLVLLGKHNSGNISKYKLINGKLIELGTAITLPSNHVLGLPYLNILPLYNGDVIINYAIDNAGVDYRKSVFKRYSFNPANASFSEINSVINHYEELSTSVSSSAVVAKDNNIYYIPAEEYDETSLTHDRIYLSLYKMDIDTLVKTKVASLPFNAYRYVSLGIKDNGDLIIAGGASTPPINGNPWVRTNNNIYTYNIVNNTFTSVRTIPSSYSTAIFNLELIKRRDSNFVIFNGAFDGPKVGDQRTMVFDATTHGLTLNTNDFGDGQIYRNTINLRNGDIIRISSNKYDPQNVYTYISDTMGAAQIDQSADLSSYVSDLVVSGNRTLTIEDPYIFNSITIEAGSTLKWLDNGNVRVFNYDDIIICKDTVMTTAEYDAMNANSVTILDGATLAIQ